jgi:hypothetical protein
MSTPSATCSQHALREAVGICVRCRAPLCSDCITKIDGINHCASCLSTLTASVRRKSEKPRQSPTKAAFAVALGACLLSLLTWLSLEVLMPGSSSR